ncbi:UTRA domain-containing protein [Shewanella psychropiezotolerans]|uniref:UTRA domain-containing protein n=1 Tax=Shewanella psychropiezotolerans TaxID=2593655 RepID=A0ABX5WWB9_9GAMM|nr:MULTISPECIES: UTRA domain-containing protein [Shewanella]MPY22609.1 UTRA domain-containing protein [Shewanella sp. YLB-07]QDO83086.1 UTRA domain-containing protein [Shewanella psychropiezotolerans]
MLLYQKIAKYIQDLIQAGSFGDGGKLPSERELVEVFSSSRITVRDALLRLESEGLIYRRQRKGWFVSPKRLKWNPVTKVNFYGLAREQGFEPKTQVLSIGPFNDDADSRLDWQEFAGQSLTKLVRTRFLDGRPVMLEEIHFATEMFPGIENKALDASITEIMASDYHIHVRSETSLVSVTALPDIFANSLETGNGAACLKIIRRRYDAKGVLIDLNVEYWLHGAIEMLVTSH